MHLMANAVGYTVLHRFFFCMEGGGGGGGG